MIDKNSSLPLYHQIMQELKQQIKDKKYEPNQVMPSEAELMRIYGVSRMTVRLAIDGLERQGYVTENRAGTFHDYQLVGEPALSGAEHAIRNPCKKRGQGG